jgi:hypothetical protein
MIKTLPIPVLRVTPQHGVSVVSRGRSRSTSSEDLSTSRETPLSSPAPLYLAALPRQKHERMRNVPDCEQWYRVLSDVQFRVYPMLSEFEMRGLRRHWERIWSVRHNKGLVRFVGVSLRPFVAEQWAFGTRISTDFVAGMRAGDVVTLCRRMAQSLCFLHEGKVIGGPSMAKLNSWVAEGEEVQLILGPSVFKLAMKNNAIEELPPEVVAGDAWTAKSDVFVLGVLIAQLVKSSAEMAETKNRIWKKLLEHVVLEATKTNTEERAIAGRLVGIFQASID